MNFMDWENVQSFWILEKNLGQQVQIFMSIFPLKFELRKEARTNLEKAEAREERNGSVYRFQVENPFECFNRFDINFLIM